VLSLVPVLATVAMTAILIMVGPIDAAVIFILKAISLFRKAMGIFVAGRVYRRLCEYLRPQVPRLSSLDRVMLSAIIARNAAGRARGFLALTKEDCDKIPETTFEPERKS
jgi:hypothetical protein